jgi:CHASE1-domain containing sensor protein
MEVPVTQSSVDYSNEQIAQIFEQAKEDFERETHQKINVLRRFDTVDEFIEQIRKEKSAFGSFREHEHPNFFRHMRNALKPIQILAQLFSGPAGNVSDISFSRHLRFAIAVLIS